MLSMENDKTWHYTSWGNMMAAEIPILLMCLQWKKLLTETTLRKWSVQFTQWKHTKLLEMTVPSWIYQNVENYA